jgi:hypothetical protein
MSDDLVLVETSSEDTYSHYQTVILCLYNAPSGLLCLGVFAGRDSAEEAKLASDEQVPSSYPSRHHKRTLLILVALHENGELIVMLPYPFQLGS